VETNLESKIQFLKGVGPARARCFEKLGIFTIEDLLYHFPVRAEDRSNRKAMADAREGEVVVLRGRVTSVRDFGRGWRKGFRVTVSDETGTVVGTWFRARFLRSQFARGQEVVLSGTISVYKNALTMTHPDFEILSSDGEVTSLSIDRIVPIYGATQGLSPALWRKLTHQALTRFSGEFTEWLPSEAVRLHGLLPLDEAMAQMHFPTSTQNHDKALWRFKYEELFLMQVFLALRRDGATTKEKSALFRMWPRLEARIRKRLPFRLTPAQDRTVKEILRDMTSPRPMNRLLEGDVGSGKTAVAVFALLTAIANKAQAAFMAPTEVLAVQHSLTLTEMLHGSRVRMALLEGGMPARKRRTMLHAIAAGDIDLVVGTHALIQKDVTFKNLGLVVVDEQHKFGVAQRARILAKGPRPDFLILTATPIPRTLALTVFGDLDVSIIDQMPPGRQPPSTKWVRSAKDEADALVLVHRELAAGRQAFFVYPAIDENEAMPLKSLETEADRLVLDLFPDYTVALLHGRLPRHRKEDVMHRFRSGEVQVLAATTVVEVGVDVPNATVMVVENAERFGLAQLHQLRGRIGRAGGPSYCFLFGRAPSPEARDRLAALEKMQDGFRIAEQDLKIRGPGDFFGTRQHGLPPLRCADLGTDLDILRLARKDAFDLVRHDPGLRTDPNAMLLEKLKAQAGLNSTAIG
jgi:ATP-dependent DNA helicase RecG